MSKKMQRIVVILVAAALLLSIVFPLLSTFASAEVSQDDINNIKGELADITELKNQVQSELNAIRGDASQAKEQVELIQGQIILVEQEISLSQQLIDEYDADIQAKEEEILKLEEQEAEQYEEFCNNVRWLEETGSVSYLSIIFRAGSFSELLDYFTLISDIMEYSNRIITELEETRTALAQAKEEQQAARDAQAKAQETLEAQKAELEVRKQEAEQIYEEIAAQESELAAKAQQLARDEQAMKNELAAAEKEYAEQIANLKPSSGWQWPLPGIYYISSIFGGRYHPITGRWESHTGTDIPAAGGTKILAANDGIVTVSQWNNSYGWYCMISHGNGRVTLYAHMRQRPSVSVGQSVSKGQVVGYVGTTGSSTGNHLHFELRINGQRANVLTLYPNLPYTGPYVSTIKKQLGLA